MRLTPHRRSVRRSALKPAPLDERFEGLEVRTLDGGLTVLVAGNRRSRMRGLAKPDAFPEDHALLIEHCRSVHTMKMRFALDLLWLHEDGTLVRRDADLKARRLKTCWRAAAVLETNAGCGKRFERALEAARN